MKEISLQTSIIYGPVTSRRFGKSLGINLLPVDRRLCTFDCIYCQYRDVAGSKGFPSFSEFYIQATSEFERLRDQGLKPDWIMISGNGEPTMHPEFADVVDGLRTLRDLHFPDTPVGILSNSTTCGKEKIRRAIDKLDGRFMKLDAGNIYTFHDVNQPSTPFIWDEMVRNLSMLHKISLQSMFVKGRVDNTVERVVDDWIATVRKIQPLEVQIYTLDREPQAEGVLAAAEETLRHISSKLLDETGIPSTVFA